MLSRSFKKHTSILVLHGFFSQLNFCGYQKDNSRAGYIESIYLLYSFPFYLTLA